MKIAVIITGDVRDCFVKDLIKNIFKHYDVFCGSYIRHEKYISNITKNYCLIDEKNDIRLPDGIKKEHMQINMLQWLHLDNIIKKFEKQLMNYDIILKYRFDYLIQNKNFINKISIKPNTLFYHSDQVFYSDSLTFIKTFKTYYDNIKNYAYYNNKFGIWWGSDQSFKLYLKQNNVIQKPLQFNNGIIIRGSFKKKDGDGKNKFIIN
tara:strand:+ start:2323 stop:2943 length:621 start_codon:yes stop_codon:yes gene_type:complete